MIIMAFGSESLIIGYLDPLGIGSLRGWSLSGFHRFHRVQEHGFYSDEIGGRVRAMERATGRRGYSEEIPRGVPPLDQRGEAQGVGDREQRVFERSLGNASRRGDRHATHLQVGTSGTRGARAIAREDPSLEPARVLPGGGEWSCPNSSWVNSRFAK